MRPISADARTSDGQWRNASTRAAATPHATTNAMTRIAPLRDPFVTPEFAIGSARPWVDDLTVHTVPAGHWVISRQPDLVAPLITDFAESAS